MRVPTTNQVIPGAFANIVLKADQPTGRTVSGKIQDVLTRGNHPRGIKVRLSDGRVGRVQSMALPSAGLETSGNTVTGTTYGSEDGLDDGTSYGAGGRAGRFGRQEQDAPQPQAVGLDAYIKPARGKKGAKRGGQQESAADEAVLAPSREEGQESGSIETQTETSLCPVCGDFEGDEAAVAHHVAGHFGD